MYFSFNCLFVGWIASVSALLPLAQPLAMSLTQPLTKVPIHFYSRFFPKTNTEVPVYEPVNKKGTKCLVFFTGGSSFITHDIYSNVLTELASLNMAVYIPPFSFTEYDSFLKQLHDEYDEVIPVAHSSGAKNVVDHFADRKAVQKMVLLDPVKTQLFRLERFRMKNIKDVLFLNAEKSYSGRPIPFIPSFLKLTEDAFFFDRKVRISTVNEEQYGHCDILNPIYSNTMYRLKICDGLSDRQGQNLNLYHGWLANQIRAFVYGNSTGSDEEKGGDRILPKAGSPSGGPDRALVANCCSACADTFYQGGDDNSRFPKVNCCSDCADTNEKGNDK